MNVDTRWLEKNQRVLNIVNPNVAVVQTVIAAPAAPVSTTQEA
jgi:hypothetical protein